MKQTRTRYQKGSLTKVKRKSGRQMWVFRWRETSEDGKRRPCKLVVGSVEEYPSERSAWVAVEKLRLSINRDKRPLAHAPRTMMELIRHYEVSELAPDNDSVAFSTKQVYKTNLKNWIEPKWGDMLLSQFEDMPGVYVEQWLKTLPLSTGTKAKVRNILSALCSHALRYGWMKNHPIRGKVRQSAKTTRRQEALEIPELQGLYSELALMYRVMILLDVPTGLRCGELLSIQWCDIDFSGKSVRICKSIWHQHLGPVKTEGSERIMPLDDDIIADLLAWRAQTAYAKDSDWVFASSKMRGKQPLWPDGVMRNHIRPAARRVGITKRLTWHTFRHTFSTLLVANNEDVKTVQSLMRHANVSITMNIYAHAVSEKKRLAQTKVVEMVLPKETRIAEQVARDSA